MKNRNIEREAVMEVSKRTGVSSDTLTKILRSQSKVVADAILRGKLESVRLPFFGIFEVKKYYYKKLINNKDAILQRILDKEKANEPLSRRELFYKNRFSGEADSPV